MKVIVFTAHAEQTAKEREILLDWIETALTAPDWQEPDPEPPRQRAYRSVPERGNRVLRVVFVEDEGEFRIITAFFDRKAQRPS